jgi:FMN phosphatase YigB (HAD superfamily)
VPRGVIEAVTFDYWNTLVHEGPGGLVGYRLTAWAGLLEEAGLPVKEHRLAAAHQLAFDDYQAAWRANRQYVVADATARMLSVLELDVPADLRGALVASFARAGNITDLQLVPGVGECLRTLRGDGVALGIVCDVGLTPSTALRGHLEQWGLLELFGSWAFSDEVGVYKPEPGIFMEALDPLGVDPARAAHVGDRLRTDVAGARALGMVSVRYSGVYDDLEEGLAEADHVIADYGELPAVLRRARALGS